MWLRVSLLACRTESAARLSAAGNSHSGHKIRKCFALKIVEVWRETATHYSRKTPMFLRGFQEGGKSDFVMKVKWQRYLETSAQSIRDLELEPAAEQGTVLCCPRPPPGFLWQHPYPIPSITLVPSPVPAAPGSTQRLLTAVPGQALGTCCQSLFHTGTFWQKKVKEL